MATTMLLDETSLPMVSRCRTCFLLQHGQALLRDQNGNSPLLPRAKQLSLRGHTALTCCAFRTFQCLCQALHTIFFRHAVPVSNELISSCPFTSSVLPLALLFVNFHKCQPTRTEAPISLQSQLFFKTRTFVLVQYPTQVCHSRGLIARPLTTSRATTCAKTSRLLGG